jgi:gas vesicle protein
MRRNLIKNHKNMSTRKLVTGILFGGVLGATVGWLTAPASGEELRRKLRGDRMSAREKIKTSEGNVESRARELTEEMSNTSVGF